MLKKENQGPVTGPLSLRGIIVAHKVLVGPQQKPTLSNPCRKRVMMLHQRPLKPYRSLHVFSSSCKTSQYVGYFRATEQHSMPRPKKPLVFPAAAFASSLQFHLHPSLGGVLRSFALSWPLLCLIFNEINDSRELIFCKHEGRSKCSLMPAPIESQLLHQFPFPPRLSAVRCHSSLCNDH